MSSAPLLRHMRMWRPRPLRRVRPVMCLSTEARSTASSSADGTAGPDATTSGPSSTDWEGLSRLRGEDRHRVEEIVRGVQAADLLLRGFEEPRVQCSGEAQANEVKELLLGSRTRPSLLAPVAGLVGAALSFPTPFKSLVTASVNRAVHESLDDGVRALRTEGTSHEATAALKEYLKQQRDSITTSAAPQGSDAVSQAVVQTTTMLCRVVIRAAAKG